MFSKNCFSLHSKGNGALDIYKILFSLFATIFTIFFDEGSLSFAEGIIKSNFLFFYGNELSHQYFLDLLVVHLPEYQLLIHW